MSDFRMALRQLVKSPGFTLVALLSLAVGIGASTAIFSLVNDFLLRSLPVRSPDELVLLRNIDGAGGRMSRSGENNGSIDPVTGRAASTSFSLLSFERMRAALGTVGLFAFAPFRGSTFSWTASRKSRELRKWSPAATTGTSACRPRSAARFRPRTIDLRTAGRCHFISLLGTPLLNAVRRPGKIIAINVFRHHRRRDGEGFRRRDAGGRIT